MKIFYLYMKNCKPLYNGLGKSEIEIDFGNSGNLFTLLNGSNGSGKTTLSNAMTPFAQEIIRDGKRGEKVIKFSHNNIVWVVIHKYTPKKEGHSVKSYLYRYENDTVYDLNENGNVTSFKDAVKDEMDIDEASIQLVKLGRDLSSLISMTPAKRKDFITNFTKEADVFINYHKKISDDCRTLQKLLSTTNTKIDNMGSIEMLNIEKDTIESSINLMSKSVESFNDTKVTLSNKIAQLSSDISNIDISAIGNIIGDYDEKDPFEEMGDAELNTIKNLNDKKISILQNRIETVNVRIDMTKGKIKEIENNMSDLDEELERIDNISNINNMIYEDISTLKNEISANMHILKDANKYGDISSKVLIHINNDINRYNAVLSSLIERLDSNELNSFDINANYELDYNEAKHKYDKYASRWTEINLEVARLSGAREMRDILRIKPKECNVSDCPFIKRALDSSSDIKTLESLDNEKTILDSLILVYLGKMETLSSYIELKNKIIEICKYIASLDREIITVCGISTDTNFLSSMMVSDKLTNIFNLTGIISAIETKEILIRKKSRLMELEILEKDYSRYKAIKTQMAELADLRKNTINEIGKYYSNIESIQEKIAKFNKMGKKYSKSIYNRTHNANILVALNDKKRYDESKLLIEEYTNRLHKTIDTINVLKKDLDTLRRQDTEISSKILQLESLNKEKDFIVKNFEEYNVLKKALSTKEGIPLIFVSVLLRKTRKIANMILKDVFGDEVKLGEFVLNAKEFAIPLIGKGEGTDDISKASAGEKSIISLALSLALAKQTSTKYNVITIDELDGPLDSTKRRLFLRILEQQAARLNIEQMFAISHNNTFDDYATDLILLKDSTINTSGKNIIYQS